MPNITIGIGKHVLRKLQTLEKYVEMDEDIMLPLLFSVAQALDAQGNTTEAARTFPIAMVRGMVKEGAAAHREREVVVDSSISTSTTSSSSSTSTSTSSTSSRESARRRQVLADIEKNLVMWRAYPRRIRAHGRNEYASPRRRIALPTTAAVNAGWSSASVSKSNKQSKGGQIDKVPQHVLFVDGLHLTARSFVQRYASRGQPIVLQNLKEYMLGERSSDAASSSRTSSSLFFWSKTNMIKKYGSYLISVTNRTLVLPLQSFGRNEDGSHFLRHTMELREFIEQHMLREPHDDDNNPLYMFGPTDVSLEQNFRVPRIFDSGAFDLAPYKRQQNMLLTLGGVGSGIWLHAHTEAYNALLFGRRQWWMLPPGMYSGKRFGSLSQSLHGKTGWNGLKKYALSFIQEEGEIVYVPAGWTHATWNLTPVVGVACELGALLSSGETDAQESLLNDVERDLWETYSE